VCEYDRRALSFRARLQDELVESSINALALADFGDKLCGTSIIALHIVNHA
jgi:hypothetical protein